MIDYLQALDIAKEHFNSKNQQTITKFYETDNMWIVYGGRKGQTKIGNAAITISKDTGNIGSFILPSKENFEILRNAKLIDIKED